MVDVIIVGGGLSGLAAAVELARQGASIALYEQSPKLGGRCYSFVDETTGDVVDNGQHVLIGAYHSTLRYLEMIGARNYLKEAGRLKLPLHHPVKGFSEFSSFSLPRPFDLVSGILKFNLVSFNDRRAMLNVVLALRRWDEQYELLLSRFTIDQWLTSLKQSDEAKKCFWNPMAISIMNELPQRASALLFARSLRAAFNGDASDSALLIPVVGQTELYVNGALSLLHALDAKINVNTEVAAIEIAGKRAVGVTLVNGEHIESASVISAVPNFSFNKLLPATLSDSEPFRNIGLIQSSPIISIHLWFDKEFMVMEYCGVIGGDVQWVFNRRKIMDEKRTQGSYLSAVISGAYKYADRSKDELVTLALRDLLRLFPESAAAKLTHALVIKEKRATFSSTNETELFRPSTETPVENLFLAGDWTNTGLPATIEGAVSSGFNAAEMAQKK